MVVGVVCCLLTFNFRPLLDRVVGDSASLSVLARRLHVAVRTVSWAHVRGQRLDKGHVLIVGLHDHIIRLHAVLLDLPSDLRLACLELLVY